MNFNRLRDIKPHRKRIVSRSKMVHPERLFIKHLRMFINAGQLDYKQLLFLINNRHKTSSNKGRWIRDRNGCLIEHLMKCYIRHCVIAAPAYPGAVNRKRKISKCLCNCPVRVPARRGKQTNQGGKGLVGKGLCVDNHRAERTCYLLVHEIGLCLACNYRVFQAIPEYGDCARINNIGTGFDEVTKMPDSKIFG